MSFLFSRTIVDLNLVWRRWKHEDLLEWIHELMLIFALYTRAFLGRRLTSNCERETLIDFVIDSVLLFTFLLNYSTCSPCIVLMFFGLISLVLCHLKKMHVGYYIIFRIERGLLIIWDDRIFIVIILIFWGTCLILLILLLLNHVEIDVEFVLCDDFEHNLRLCWAISLIYLLLLLLSTLALP